MTAQDLIKSALRKLNVLAVGEKLNGDDAADYLVVLNDMIDAWNAESLMIFTQTPHTFPLTTAQSYTLGAGGDFNMARPPKIDRAVLQVTSNPSFPLELPLKMWNDEQWASITLKSLSNTYPEGFWDDGGFPLRTLYFWPVPSGASLNVILWTWTPLTSWTSLTTDLTLPPAYAKALKYNLALELSSEVGEVPADILAKVAAIAGTSKGVIKRMNSDNNTPLMSCDKALTPTSTTPAVSRADFLGGRF